MTITPIPSGAATNHDRIPADVFDAALEAAFPGLPHGMSLDEAARRIAAALNTAWPMIEQRVREQAAREIETEAAREVTWAEAMSASPARAYQHAARIARGTGE